MAARANVDPGDSKPPNITCQHHTLEARSRQVQGQGRSCARLHVVADAIAERRRPLRLKKPSELTPSPLKEPDAAKHRDQAPPPRMDVTAATCPDLLLHRHLVVRTPVVCISWPMEVCVVHLDEAGGARCHGFRPKNAKLEELCTRHASSNNLSRNGYGVDLLKRGLPALCKLARPGPFYKPTICKFARPGPTGKSTN